MMPLDEYNLIWEAYAEPQDEFEDFLWEFDGLNISSPEALKETLSAIKLQIDEKQRELVEGEALEKAVEYIKGLQTVPEMTFKGVIMIYFEGNDTLTEDQFKSLYDRVGESLDDAYFGLSEGDYDKNEALATNYLEYNAKFYITNQLLDQVTKDAEDKIEYYNSPDKYFGL